MKLVQDTDFNSSHFVVGADIKLKKAAPEVYTCTWSSGVRSGEGDNIERRRLSVSNNGFGMIHLDFVTNHAGEHILANLSSGAPTPASLIEAKDGDAFIWIDRGSRAIKARGFTPGRRNIVNLIGFFA